MPSPWSGARNASANGRLLAETMARELGQQGWVVVSGLARGIDSAGHRGALASGTIAVLAGGLDRPYPPESEPLYHAIAERGLVVSEMPLGRVPQARHFPQRNRIVSGLAAGHRGGGGGPPIRLPHHRPAGRRAGPRGDGGSRLPA